MPYDPDDYLIQPDKNALEEAHRFRAKRWYRVSNNSQIRSHLVNRQPIVCGILIYDNAFSLSGKDSVHNTKGDYIGHHAVTIVGYDNNRFGGAFKLINSWSRCWGDKGFFWIPYSFVSEVLEEAYALVDDENQVKPDPDDEDDTTPEPPKRLANLDVVSWSATYSPQPRGKGKLQYAIVNSGEATVPAGVKVNFMLSKNATITSNDAYVVYEEVPFEIKPGTRIYRDEDNTIAFTIPETVTEGQYYMALWVDDEQEVQESNEKDNVSLSKDLIVIGNSKPDLAINKWFVDLYPDNERWELTYEIANKGNTTADNSKWNINVVLSLDENLGDDNDIFVFTEKAGHSLEPGHSVIRRSTNPAYFSLSKDVKGNPVPLDSYYIALWVDDLDLVDESNELNNTSFSWIRYPGGLFKKVKKDTERRLKALVIISAGLGRVWNPPLLKKNYINTTLFVIHNKHCNHYNT